jgi:hypothetical protein
LCEVHERTHPARLFRASRQRRQYARFLSPLRQRLRALAWHLGGWFLSSLRQRLRALARHLGGWFRTLVAACPHR